MGDRDRTGGVETDITGRDAAAAEHTAGVSPSKELKVDKGPDEIIRHGRTTVVTSGTPVSLIGAGIRTRSVLITNPLDNSGNPVIYIGNSAMTIADGFPRTKGAGISMDIDNAEDEIFVDSSIDDRDVTWIATDKDK